MILLGRGNQQSFPSYFNLARAVVIYKVAMSQDSLDHWWEVRDSSTCRFFVADAHEECGAKSNANVDTNESQKRRRDDDKEIAPKSQREKIKRREGGENAVSAQRQASVILVDVRYLTP